MANEIKRKIFLASTAFTITIANLASSIVGVGVQSDIVDGTASRPDMLEIYTKIRLGTSPSAGEVSVYLIADDNNGTNHRSDGAGASDAGITILNASLIGVLTTLASPATGNDLYGEFKVPNPPPKFGIALVHNTGVNLDVTPSDHWARYVLRGPEIQ